MASRNLSQMHAEIIAHRLGFRVCAIERALKEISDDPLTAYLEIATLPEKDACLRLWKALASADLHLT